MANFSVYKYFKGEAASPYTDSNDSMYWYYEKIFHERFHKGDFSTTVWQDVVKHSPEAKQVLAGNPVNLEELFKLYLYFILMIYLPDKYMVSDINYFKNLYWATTSTSI